MTRVSIPRLFTTALLLMFLVALLIYSSHLSSSRAQTQGESVGSSKPEVKNLNFLLAAPYWRTDYGYVSTIEMKNYHVEQPLTVTVVLYPLDGPEIILSPMTLNPSETRLLNINQVLAEYGKRATVGAAEIKYSQLIEGVFGANLTVLNSSKSLIYNFQFRLPELTPRLEGLWWFYDSHTDGFIAVQNTSDKNVTVVPALYIRERKRQLELLQLKPHQTKLIELRRELKKLQEDEVAGGIELRSSESGAVIAGGGLVSPDVGFSAPLRVEDPDMQAMRAKRLGQTLHALGVAIGADDPTMSMGLPSSARMNPIVNLRNVSNQPIQVTPVFRYQAGNRTKTFALKPIQLRSQQVQRIDLLPYWQSGQIPSSASSGSLELNYSGKPAALLATVTAVDQTGSYVFDAKIDNKLAAGFHGEYWSTEGDNDTFITIKNITDKPATAWVSLQYDAGRGEYDLPPMVLQAGESHMIDLKMIQKEGMPGASSELLPETAVYGGLKLREEPGGRHFLIDTVVFNPKTATCGVCGFGCLYPTYINIPGGTYIVALADSGELIVVNAHMCDGTNQTGWECVSEFSTDDEGVAQVDPWCQSRGYGLTTGGTTIRSVATDVPGPHCGEQTLLASRPVQVFTFTVGVSPGEVRPSGTGGTVASTVTVSTSPATAGKSVSLSAAAHNNGGHVGHTGSRPLGSFAPSSGTTDSTGKFSSTYTASIFGGGVDITATIGGGTRTQYLEVRVPDLGSIAVTNDWNLVGTTGTHPDNHYGTATTNVGLAAIARDYNDQYYGVGQYPPDADKVRFNDMGLVNGGKFDLSNSWSATSDHQEHKLGLNCDFYSGNVPTSRWGFLTGRFVVRGSQDYLDETATKNHWHLRFTQ